MAAAPIYAASNGEVTSGSSEIDQTSAKDTGLHITAVNPDTAKKGESEPRKTSLSLPHQSGSTDNHLLNSDNNLNSRQGMTTPQEGATLSLHLRPTIAPKSSVLQQLQDLKQHLSMESDEDLNNDSSSNPPPHPPPSSPSPPPLLPAKKEYEALRASAPAKIKGLREVIERCEAVLSNLERKRAKREGGEMEEEEEVFVESLVFCTQVPGCFSRKDEGAEAEGEFSIFSRKDKAQLEEEIREKEKILAEVRLQEEAVKHQLADAQSKMSMLQQQHPKQQK